MKFTNRRGKLRLLDGTGTPFYLELGFDTGDMNAPLGVPSTEEQLVLHRGTFDANAHYIEGGDAPVMEPVDVGFSIVVEDTTITTYLLDWLEGNTVNSNTIVTTKGTTERTNSIATPAFADTSKKTCNLEILWDASATGTDLGYQYNEVYFALNDQKIAEAEDGVTITFAGKCYGTIARLAAFTAGTDVTA